MGDARRRRLLTKPFPPVVVPAVVPCHREGCYARTSLDRETCGCAAYARLEARSRRRAALILAMAATLSAGTP